jgi:hypothetical protein
VKENSRAEKRQVKHKKISDIAAKKAVGKRTRVSVKADVVAPKEKKWWPWGLYMLNTRWTAPGF